MMIGNLKESLEIFFWIRATLHSKKIDDLDEELRLTVAGFANGLDKLFQSRQKSIVTDAQQRPAGNVANPGRFNHQRRGPALGKPPIPIKIILRDKSIFSRAPGDHRRHPRATGERDWTNSHWPETKSPRAFGG